MKGGGHEVPTDRVEAQRCFRAAAERGHAYAQMMYGRYLARGLGGDRNPDRARIGWNVPWPRACRKPRTIWPASPLPPQPSPSRKSPRGNGDCKAYQGSMTGGGLERRRAADLKVEGLRMTGKATGDGLERRGASDWKDEGRRMTGKATGGGLERRRATDLKVEGLRMTGKATGGGLESRGAADWKDEACG